MDEGEGKGRGKKKKIEERVFFPREVGEGRKRRRGKGNTEGAAGAALVIWVVRKMGKAETGELGEGRKEKGGRFFGGGGLFSEA